mgnify:CR=1 FL=1
MGYSKITLYGGANINYFHTRNYVANNTEINQIASKGIYLPEWDDDTVMLATYQNSLNASSLKVEEGDVIGYKIQRLDVDENILYQVADTVSTKIQDYNVSSDKIYKYYIFPIILINNIKTLGAPIITEPIQPEWNGCTIIGLIKTDKKNEYTVDINNIWSFEANVVPDDYVLNMDKTFTDGFGRFSKKNQGLKKYITGGTSALVGTVDCKNYSFKTGISKIEKWEDFCFSSNLKLFKDINGRILPVDIKEESSNYLNPSYNSPISTSFSIVQMDDYKELSVYSTEELL